MPRVLIASPAIQDYDGPYLKTLEDAGCEIWRPERCDALDEGTLKRLVPGIDAIVAGSEPYTREVLKCADRLKIIARAGVGYDAVDVGTATELGIAVSIAPGSNHHAVADYVMTLMLSLVRQDLQFDRIVRGGRWERYSVLSPNGATLGIVGFGRVGQAVAQRARGFEMRILVAEPFPNQAALQAHGAELVPLERLLRESDVVTLNCFLSPETRRLINSETLALMKPTAHLINTARGELIDEEALADALQNGRLAGAGLDVFATEPLPADSPLRSLDNVILSPHIAGVDDLSFHLMTKMAAEAILSVLRGDWPVQYLVNPEAKKK